MSPKEKAKDIYDKMKGFRITNRHRKKCALVCVKEILNSNNTLFSETHNVKHDCNGYWREVEREIEIL